MELRLKYEHYTHYPLDEIFLRYAILPKDSKSSRTILKSRVKKTSHLTVLTRLNLPATLDLTMWGKVNSIGDNLCLISKNKQIITVMMMEGSRSVTVLTNNGKDKLLSFIDTILSLSDDHFERVLDNGTHITYKGGEQIRIVQAQKAGVFMKPVEKAMAYSFNAITLDLETRTVPGPTTILGKETVSLEAVSAATYNGTDVSTYFITDYASSEARG